MGTNYAHSTIGKRYKAEEMIVDEEFGKIKFAHDIALIKVQGKLEFNGRVQPIKLDTNAVATGTKLMFYGWGQLANGNNPRTLQVIYFAKVSDEECKKVLSAQIHESHICTLNKVGQGICKVCD